MGHWDVLHGYPNIAYSEKTDWSSMRGYVTKKLVYHRRYAATKLRMVMGNANDAIAHASGVP